MPAEVLGLVGDGFDGVVKLANFVPMQELVWERGFGIIASLQFEAGLADHIEGSGEFVGLSFHSAHDQFSTQKCVTRRY